MTTVPRSLTSVHDVMERRLGLSWSGVRADAIENDIRRAMAAAGTDDPDTYAQRLRSDPTALDELAESLRVGETFFLREPGQLDAIKGLVLPAMAHEPQGSDRPLHVWSAGCASGEETYTLAILLEQAGLIGRVEVLGTDRSETAIAAARRGEYRPWALRAVDDDQRGRWFDPPEAGERWSVTARLRRGVTFRCHDLVEDPYPAGQDLVVCRNVLLYLTAAGGRSVVERLAGALAPGGWLVLGSSDPHHDAGDLLEPVRTGEGHVYRRPGGPGTAPPPIAARGAARTPAPPPHRPAGTSATAPPSTPSSAPAPTPATTRDVADALARCERDLARRPLDADAHGLHAMRLLEAGQPARAHRAAAAALFLTPDLPGVQVLLGRAHLALGDTAAAARAFRNARHLLIGLPDDTLVPPSDTTAERLLEAVEAADTRLTDRSADGR